MMKLSLFLVGVFAASASAQLICTPQDIAVDAKLKDSAFMKKQIDCILDRGICDEIGQEAKRSGPAAISGHCVYPCNKCTQKSVRKVKAAP